MSKLRLQYIAPLLWAISFSVYGQTIDEVVAELPVPPNAQDISERLCTKPRFGGGFDIAVSDADQRRYRNSQLPRVLAAWGRKYFAAGRSEQACSEVDTALLVGRLNMLVANDSSQVWKAESLQLLFNAEDKVIERSKQAARKQRAEAQEAARKRAEQEQKREQQGLLPGDRR